MQTFEVQFDFTYALTLYGVHDVHLHCTVYTMCTYTVHNVHLNCTQCALILYTMSSVHCTLIPQNKSSLLCIQITRRKMELESKAGKIIID